MKIVITGSLGHISRPLTKELVQKGHRVTVISSKAERQKDIEAMGAIPAIGSVEDVYFLESSFNGADAVYTMLPPGNYFDQGRDMMEYVNSVGNNYAKAIQHSGVKHVVHLSSVGAHLEKGSGLILGHRQVELILNSISGVSITFMRPVGFYYNLYEFIPTIKQEGIIKANYGGDKKLIWVSPTDIAAAVAEEIVIHLAGKKILYVASDELTGNETAAILGAAIGKPDLQWKIISSEQWQQSLEAAGMNPKIASGLVEMFASQQSGALTADYYLHKPVMGKVKMKDFAKEFAAVYNQKEFSL